ncbi:MAG TPA: prenyltransferase [Candidatus Eisenbacteria bacterium]|nr:prenyltransferase [Candidatus Eisenbacteria bacterium]
MAERVETAPQAVGTPSFGELVDNWRHALMQGNLPKGRAIDGVSKWLLIVRACVFSMTLTSGLIGGLLAGATAAHPRWGLCALACLGLVLAHAANNMINDYFDTAGGVDTAEYTRALYAPHPILSGLISKKGLIAAIAAVNLADLVIMCVLTAARGWPVVAFALAGLFISVFYVAPPLKLKHHGLGEPGVAIVWGPLMIGGTYFVTAGEIPSWVWLATLPYAITVTTVLIGKHIDKYDQDSAKGIHTLPVILGKQTSLRLNEILMIAFYPIVALLVLRGDLGWGVLLVAFAIPRLIEVLKRYREPKPASAPPGYFLWPLWYVSIAFYHNRLAGGLFVLGLIVNLAFGH